MASNRTATKHKLIVWCIFVASSLLMAACGNQRLQPEPDSVQIRPPTPVILDVDMALDDILATLFLLEHPNLQVRAITVAGTGVAHCAPGVRNALGLVALSGREGIPVTCGRETPLSGDHAFPAAWRQSADDAYGIPLPDGGEADALGAPELMTDLLQSSSDRLTIVALGPLTTLAEAIQRSPQIVSNVAMIYIMGGALEVEGNIGASGAGIQNDVAEWNTYIDPAAASIVLNSGAPLTLVPLDATRSLPVTRRFHKALGANRTTPEASLAYDILSANRDFLESGGLYFWDPLAAAIATDESLATFEEVQLSVVEEEGPLSGLTEPTTDGPQIRVAMDDDKMRFEQLFLTVLNWNGQR